MLVLTRKIGESINIGGNVKVKIVQVRGKQVRLGIEAPRETKVHRQEVLDNANTQPSSFVDKEPSLQTL